MVPFPEWTRHPQRNHPSQGPQAHRLFGNVTCWLVPIYDDKIPPTNSVTEFFGREVHITYPQKSWSMKYHAFIIIYGMFDDVCHLHRVLTFPNFIPISTALTTQCTNLCLNGIQFPWHVPTPGRAQKPGNYGWHASENNNKMLGKGLKPLDSGVNMSKL